MTKAFMSAKATMSCLLAPACASFDMFQSFEERGKVFKETVLHLATAMARRSQS